MSELKPGDKIYYLNFAMNLQNGRNISMEEFIIDEIVDLGDDFVRIMHKYADIRVSSRMYKGQIFKDKKDCMDYIMKHLERFVYE